MLLLVPRVSTLNQRQLCRAMRSASPADEWQILSPWAPTVSTSTPRATKSPCHSACHPFRPGRRHLSASVPRFGSLLPLAGVKGARTPRNRRTVMKVEQAKQIANEAIDQLSEALERGHSETLKKYLAAMAMFHRYSLHNLILIVSQRPDATRIAGFHTWKKLGRNVKRGAKGIMILAPVVLRKEKEEPTSEEGHSKAAVGFRAVYVFDQMDTEGKPLSELGSAQGDPAGYTEKLKQFIAERGIQLEYSDSIYPAQGQCSLGKIVLLPGQ